MAHKETHGHAHTPTDMQEHTPKASSTCSAFRYSVRQLIRETIAIVQSSPVDIHLFNPCLPIQECTTQYG